MKAKIVEINGYEFRVLRASTIAGGVKLNEYRYAHRTSLDECYKKCSEEKWDAFYRCNRLRRAVHGTNPKIPSSNGWAFTYSFVLPDGAVVYITKDHRYIIK